MERAFAAQRVKPRRSSAPATGSAAMRLAGSSEAIRQRASAPRTALAAFPARIAPASKAHSPRTSDVRLSTGERSESAPKKGRPALRTRRQDTKRSQERPARRRSVIRLAARRRAAACTAPLRPSTRSDRPAPLPSRLRRPHPRWRDSESRTATKARSAASFKFAQRMTQHARRSLWKAALPFPSEGRKRQRGLPSL